MHVNALKSSFIMVLLELNNIPKVFRKLLGTVHILDVHCDIWIIRFISCYISNQIILKLYYRTVISYRN